MATDYGSFAATLVLGLNTVWFSCYVQFSGRASRCILQVLETWFLQSDSGPVTSHIHFRHAREQFGWGWLLVSVPSC